MKTSTQRGFTLMELLVAMAIVGILSALAFSSYTSSVTKSRRAEGKAALLSNAGGEERYYTVNNTYTTTMADAGAKAYSGNSSSTSAYTIAIAAGSGGIATGYTMTATPAQSDPVCGNLSITQSGAKSFSGTSGSTAQCW